MSVMNNDEVVDSAPNSGDAYDETTTTTTTTEKPEQFFKHNSKLSNPNEPMRFVSNPRTGIGSHNSDNAKAWETLRPASDKAKFREENGLLLSDIHGVGHEDSRQERFRRRSQHTGAFLRDFSVPARELPPSVLSNQITERVKARIENNVDKFEKDVQHILNDLEANARPPHPTPPMHHLPAHPYGHPTLLGNEFIYEDGDVVKHENNGLYDNNFGKDWKHEWVHTHWSRDHTGISRHINGQGQTDAEAKAEAHAVFSIIGSDHSGSVSASEIIAFFRGSDKAKSGNLRVSDIENFMRKHSKDSQREFSEAEFVEFFGIHDGEEILPSPWCYMRESPVDPPAPGSNIFIPPNDTPGFGNTVIGDSATRIGSRVLSHYTQLRDAQNRRVMADLLAQRHRHKMKQKRVAGLPIDELSNNALKIGECVKVRTSEEAVLSLKVGRIRRMNTDGTYDVEISDSTNKFICSVARNRIIPKTMVASSYRRRMREKEREFLSQNTHKT